MTISFVGTNYHGSQIQQNAVTVQSEFQIALKKTIGSLPDIKCCSRTDSGVHANRYCISFSTECKIPVEKLPIALNTELPPDIRALSVRHVPDDFHARYDCVKKRYVYKVWNSKIMDPFMYGRALQFIRHIDEHKLNETAQIFVGTHDFEAMCSSKCDAESTVRTVYDFSVTRENELVLFSVSADGFLYNMVRIMVGTLLSCARGKLSTEDIKNVLNTKKRINLCMTAPSEGLYLDDVIYNFTE
ncbi:MAG: tRNA pseudouridine(38-40) synthase TruA [Oscillospiraceae bacterium]